jgi:hypothetical protein
MVLSCIPDSGKSGMGMGADPRSPANRGWGWGWGSGVPCPAPTPGPQGWAPCDCQWRRGKTSGPVTGRKGQVQSPFQTGPEWPRGPFGLCPKNGRNWGDREWDRDDASGPGSNLRRVTGTVVVIVWTTRAHGQTVRTLESLHVYTSVIANYTTLRPRHTENWGAG